MISAALMLTCREMTVLIEQSNHDKIGVVARMKMAAHTAICKPCAAFKAQSRRIDAMLQKAMKMEYIVSDSQKVQLLKADIKKLISRRI